MNDFRRSLDSLIAAAEAADLDPVQARRDALVVSAAIAESNRGAYLDWCRGVGLEPDSESFFDAAVKGRRYRASAAPSALAALARGGAPADAFLLALTEVCSAAAMLGEPGLSATAAAATAAAAQSGRPASLAMPTPPLAREDEAQRRFTERAPGILNDVLQRLGTSQQRLLDLQHLDPGLPGAIAGIGNPVVPTQPSAPAGPSDQVGQQPPTAEPAVEEEPPPEEPEKSVEEWLAELDALVGLATVKAEIHRQTAILKVDGLRTKAGLKSPTITRHLIFTGNPGTGKTTVARMVAGIYRAIGLLSKGQLVEVDRSELVAGYLGQTAMKTAEVVSKAIGGVLFIDEAYSLNGDQYGEEAINTLVKEMEDNRDDLVVIVAGYPAPMSIFIAQNPGLASRFRTEISFDNYTDAELEAIFIQMATKSDYDLGEGSVEAFRGQLALQLRDESFGNGRFARNVLEAAIGQHAWRLRDESEPTLHQLRTLVAADIVGDPPSAVEWPTDPA